ncbi:hypothetical protein [Bacteroides caccae]|uniref:hypothetical protein n=1 Tax=Bacteroides caccae TaxID=47678 RepID=UPI00129CD410|nr:hypothetical protein [Bacteroides caccae]
MNLISGMLFLMINQMTTHMTNGVDKRNKVNNKQFMILTFSKPFGRNQAATQ